MGESLLGPFEGGAALREYIERYRRTDLPVLEVGAALDLHPSRLAPASFTPQLTWEHPWPFNNRAGVYMIYNEALELMYIGKVSMNLFLGIGCTNTSATGASVFRKLYG